jgi:NAD(P)-dependent dehydrogenase (short-subunit alcohol dehydrogenase family)
VADDGTGGSEGQAKAPGASRWGSDDIPDQTGRTVLVTGANSGLGLATAEALAGAGARVLLACRNAEKAARALELVAARAAERDGPEPVVVALDLADLASVQACAAEVAGLVEHLDVLVNNAGVMALPLRRTADDFEMQLGTNHLGHFALTGRLLPALLAAEAPRVVNVSSNAHKFGKIRWDDPNWERGRYSKWQAYGQTKLANLLFSSELQRRAIAAATKLLVASAHPGYTATELSSVGPSMSGNKLMGMATALFERAAGQSVAMGALPQLYAASMPDVGPDEYFGPDGPGEFRGHPTRVRRSDAASNLTEATRLWKLSERLTGVTYPWP